MSSYFDVFLCHNDKDKPLVAAIEATLRDNNINPFFDKWVLLPGRSFLEKIEAAFNQSQSCAVFIGPYGIGPIQKGEIEISLIRQLTEGNFPVIPVFLPGANKSGLSRFLSKNTWVDFRDAIDNPEALQMLIAAIKGDEQILKNLSIQEIYQSTFDSSRRQDTILSDVTFEDIKKALLKASNSLLNWPTTLADGQWLDREELNLITSKIESESATTTLLLGVPGSGKSALLSRLAQELRAKAVTILAIKADLLSAEITTEEQLMKSLNLPANPNYCLEVLSKLESVVLIVDQLDALADMVDLRSQRLNVLLDLIHDLTGLPNVHIVASCRDFEHHHDPRLRNLEADNLFLELPPIESVTALLQTKKIQSSGWPQDFLEMLRRPQYLKVFMDFSRGTSEPEIFNSYHAMLNRLWEEKVLSKGKDYTELLDRMSSTMGEREELWLPAALYQEHMPLIRHLEAEGILTIESDGQRVGFRHQTLFEYARARAFVKIEGSLSDYVLKRQNGLFVRPQLWNAMNYLRSADLSSYKREFSTLWNNNNLRFHLRILLIEFLGQLPTPEDFEANWLLPHLENTQYRRRILSCMEKSQGWFNLIKDTYIPMFMTLPHEEAFEVVFLLKSASSFDKDKVLNLIDKYWMKDTSKDHLSLLVLDQLKEWDERPLIMACQILERTDIADYFIDSLSSLVSENAPELAPRMVRAYLNHCLAKARQEAFKEAPPLPEAATEEQRIVYSIEHNKRQPYEKLLEIGLHNLPVIAEAAPKAFLDHVWPWFIEIVRLIAYEPHQIRIGYRDDHSLVTDLSGDRDIKREYPIMTSLEDAITCLAVNEPDAFLTFFKEWGNEDLLVVQRILARGLKELVNIYPVKVFEFLIDDSRRLILGGHQDYHSDTSDLIKLVVPKLDKDKAYQLETVICQFNIYKDSWQEDSSSIKLDRIKYNRQHRLRILKSFPIEYMSEKTRRLVIEEERAFPDLKDYDTYFSGIYQIGSPMSAQQMAKAKDDDILGLFAELGNNSDHHPKNWKKGGTYQASQAFEELAKDQPERATGLISKMQPQKNELAVSHAIAGLAKSNFSSGKLFLLIQELNKRGFESKDFHHYAARAIGERLNSDAALSSELIDLLESWLKPFKDEQEKKQKENSESEDADKITSVLWRHDGFRILPHGNYSILETLTRACLWGKPSDIGRWLSILESHVLHKEDPEVWKMLSIYLPSLSLSDKTRAEKFIDTLFLKHPDLFNSDDGAILVARVQSWVSDSLVQKWLFGFRNGNWSRGAQACAEILLLRHAWFPESTWVKECVTALRQGDSGESDKMKMLRMGLAFSAAELFSEPIYRTMATEFLLDIIPDPNEDVLKAVSRIFGMPNSFLPDECTWKILDLVCKYPKNLSYGRSGYLIEQLECLLATNPEKIYHVCNAFLNQIGKELSDIRRGFLIWSEHFINIALTLQRFDSPHRERGLELFEQLLNLDAWHARETLLELDRRPIQTSSPQPRRRRKKKNKK